MSLSPTNKVPRWNYQIFCPPKLTCLKDILALDEESISPKSKAPSSSLEQQGEMCGHYLFVHSCGHSKGYQAPRADKKFCTESHNSTYIQNHFRDLKLCASSCNGKRCAFRPLEHFCIQKAQEAIMQEISQIMQDMESMKETWRCNVRDSNPKNPPIVTIGPSLRTLNKERFKIESNLAIIRSYQPTNANAQLPLAKDAVTFSNAFNIAIRTIESTKRSVFYLKSQIEKLAQEQAESEVDQLVASTESEDEKLLDPLCRFCPEPHINVILDQQLYTFRQAKYDASKPDNTGPNAHPRNDTIDQMRRQPKAVLTRKPQLLPTNVYNPLPFRACADFFKPQYFSDSMRRKFGRPLPVKVPFRPSGTHGMVVHNPTEHGSYDSSVKSRATGETKTSILVATTKEAQKPQVLKLPADGAPVPGTVVEKAIVTTPLEPKPVQKPSYTIVKRPSPISSQLDQSASSPAFKWSKHPKRYAPIVSRKQTSSKLTVTSTDGASCESSKPSSISSNAATPAVPKTWAYIATAKCPTLPAAENKSVARTVASEFPERAKLEPRPMSVWPVRNVIIETADNPACSVRKSSKPRKSLVLKRGSVQ